MTSSAVPSYRSLRQRLKLPEDVLLTYDEMLARLGLPVPETLSYEDMMARLELPPTVSVGPAEMAERMGISPEVERGLAAVTLQELLGLPSLDPSSLSYLDRFPPDRIPAIVREARRLKGARSSIPFYADKAKRDGDVLWLRLAASYQGD